MPILALQIWTETDSVKGFGQDSDREARGVNRMIALEVVTPTFETSYE